MAAARCLAGAALIVLAACGSDAGQDVGNETSVNDVARQLAAVQIRPGLWEATSRVEDATAPGLPREVQARMKGRTNTVRNCITPEQAARPDANFLAAQGNGDCTYRDFRMAGGELRGQMQCSGGDLPGRINTTMVGRYEPERYDINMDMQTTGMPAGADLRMVMRVSGRRVGECTGGETGS